MLPVFAAVYHMWKAQIKYGECLEMTESSL